MSYIQPKTLKEIAHSLRMEANELTSKMQMYSAANVRKVADLLDPPGGETGKAEAAARPTKPIQFKLNDAVLGRRSKNTKWDRGRIVGFDDMGHPLMRQTLDNGKGDLIYMDDETWTIRKIGHYRKRLIGWKFIPLGSEEADEPARGKVFVDAWAAAIQVILVIVASAIFAGSLYMLAKAGTGN